MAVEFFYWMLENWSLGAILLAANVSAFLMGVWYEQERQKGRGGLW